MVIIYFFVSVCRKIMFGGCVVIRDWWIFWNWWIVVCDIVVNCVCKFVDFFIFVNRLV